MEEEAELLERFGAFLKSSFIYPSNNERVHIVLAEFMSALADLRRPGRPRVAVLLADSDFLIADRLVESKTAMARWTHRAFVKTFLGGVEIDSAVEAEQIVEFAQLLQANFTSRDRSFDLLWKGKLTGVIPVELRFSGTHRQREGADQAALRAGSVVDAQDHLIQVILGNSELMTKLETLQKEIVDHLPPDSVLAELDILSQISKALPVEALLDISVAEQLVDGILDACVARVPSMVHEKRVSDRDVVDVAVAEVGRRYFKAHLKEVMARPLDALPEGRPGDEVIVDDLEAMLAEYEALPRGEIHLELGSEVETKEALGVYLHHLVEAPEEDEKNKARLSALLVQHPEQASLLTPYLDLCLSEDGLRQSNRRFWRVVDFVQQAGLTHLFKGCEFLTPRVVAFTFPRQFVPFLDTLDGRDPKDLAKIVGVCERLGAERIEVGADFLVQHDKMITPERLEKLIATKSPAVFPLIRIMLLRGGEWVREPVGRFLRERNPPGDQSGALRVVRPLSRLSAHYLAHFCTEHPNSSQKRWAIDESTRLLRMFLMETAGDDEWLEQRTRAVHMLCAVPSRDNLSMLQRVAKEHGPLTLRRARRQLRDAARSGFKKMSKALFTR